MFDWTSNPSVSFSSPGREKVMIFRGNPSSFRPFESRTIVGTLTSTKPSMIGTPWANAANRLRRVICVYGDTILATIPRCACRWRLTVPAAILSALPPMPAANGESSMLTMGVSAIMLVEFSAEGLDRGTVAYTQLIVRSTKYK